jgi:GcrA cell cycle regulator
VSSRLIGLALGRTRGVVRGRVDRLKLPARASPSAELPPLVEAPVVQLEMLPVPAPPGPKPVPLRLWLVPTTPPRECQWPQGEKPRMRFCFKPAFPGKPYCLAHSQLAYVGFGRPRPVGHAWVSP